MFRIAILPTADEVNDKRYMAYITVDKVGIHALPLDGNPHNSMAMIAHPQGVSLIGIKSTGTSLALFIVIQSLLYKPGFM